MSQKLTKPQTQHLFLFYLMFMILPHGMDNAITWNDTADDDENSTGPRFVALQFVQRDSFCIECLEKHTCSNYTVRRKRYDGLCYHSHTTFVYLHIKIA